ncbi:MAG: diguanylate cyclase [Rhodospirillaceae bacterium]|jgi:diguanylate cyclase (GGDEF)-like protein|nr:diguanylate cyclase [Rhodospirillales bacterium]MBT3907781.1 diguanylate cyclase [Rhodospirillaceae bacterium]MBT4700409.1 diguanylate cyclase [Rhodospirillaceae bacterium]MBT5033385.1 diguanylate cyclase [Rhodospirillaceae bacterium]MBT6219229.1 diguanylate cyclase [Rhodospirillaceae bacterium]
MVDVTNLQKITPASATDKRSKDSHRKKTGHDAEDKAEDEVQATGDLAFIMDFPVEELTPKVYTALTNLVAEFNRQRDELEHTHDHALYLEEQADKHEYLPTLSRRGLLRHLSRIMAHSERAGLTNGFVYLHVRNLGEIRRNHGRQAAEHALVHVAEVLQNELRDSDVLGSLGGEDFGVVLTVTDAASVKDKANELASALESRRVRWGVSSLDVEIWTGIHIFRSAPTPEEIIEAADRVLIDREGRPALESVIPSEISAGRADEDVGTEDIQAVAEDITSADVLLMSEIAALTPKDEDEDKDGEDLGDNIGQ